jgi:hypothetical protein
MTEGDYTIHDTPTTVRRIQRDLSLVIQSVRAHDPALRSLVLTGGFARGEGSILHGEPQNDYDFVALRGLGTPKTPYPRVTRWLEETLGLHIDLAPVPVWRLRRVSRSIFWYETALRGRVVWGEDLLDRIPVRTPADLDPREGVRLLVNRAAGLLTATLPSTTDHARRIQASKALLAVGDAHLLAAGAFAPSQRERWDQLRRLLAEGLAAPALDSLDPWLTWAFQFKVDPGSVEARDAEAAWRAAARAVLDTLPVALAHADLGSIDAYAEHDGLADHLVYYRRAGQVDGARRMVRNPTGRVRRATITMLEEALDGARMTHGNGDHALAGMVRRTHDPVQTLEALRRVTLQ